MLGVRGALQTAHSLFHPVTPDVSVCPYHCLVCFQIRSLNGLCQEQSRKLVSSTLYMEFHLFSPKHKLTPCVVLRSCFCGSHGFPVE